MRRGFLFSCLLTAVLTMHVTACASDTADIVIENGYIVDGSGAPKFKGDVAISDGRIISVGMLSNVEAKRRIDAEGMIVAPGFIDGHSHTGVYMLDPEKRLNESSLTQGVSTVVFGADGEYSPKTLQQMLQKLQRQGTGTNIGFYVGHNGIRQQVLMQDQQRKPTSGELIQMADLVKEGMLMGAVGFSTGLMYEPGRYSDTAEVIELTKAVKEFGGIYDSHVRDPARALVASDQEVIEIGSAAGVAAKIAHIKAVCLNNRGNTQKIISMVNRARSAGQNVVSDQYPYDGAKTAFLRDVFLTSKDMSFAEIKQALLEETSREEIRETSENGINGGFSWLKATGYRCIRITHSKDFPEYEGKYLSEIAGLMNSSGFDATADLVLAAKHEIRITLGGVDEEDVQAFLVQPWNMIVSDGKYINEKSSRRQHPRSTGSFTKIFRKYVREAGLLSLEQSIAKMTSEPADFLGFSGRGRIAVNKAADIVVFDASKIADQSNWANPLRYSKGIRYLLINGKVALKDGRVEQQTHGVLVKRTKKTSATLPPIPDQPFLEQGAGND